MQECKNHVKQQKVVRPKDMVELESIDLNLPEKVIIPKLMHNLRNEGFFALTNIKDYDEGELFTAVKAFYHDISEAERRKLVWKNFAPKHDNVYRGLSPFVPNAPEHKELYDMGGDLDHVSDEALPLPLYEETPFPPQKKYQWIKMFFN